MLIVEVVQSSGGNFSQVHGHLLRAVTRTRIPLSEALKRLDRLNGVPQSFMSIPEFYIPLLDAEQGEDREFTLDFKVILSAVCGCAAVIAGGDGDDGERAASMCKLILGLEDLRHKLSSFQTGSTSDGETAPYKPMPSPHELLGVTPYASLEKIKKAYRQKAKEWHPDLLDNMAPELKAFATERFAQINAAYDELRTATGGDTRPKEPQPQTEPRPTKKASTQTAPPWSPVPQTGTGYDSVSTEASFHPSEQHTETITIWRCAKVFLRCIWRIVKILLLMSSALLIAAILVFALIVALQDYWKNETENAGYHPIGSLADRLLSHLSRLTLLPREALGGFIFIFSILFLGLAIASQSVIEFGSEHTSLCFGLAGVFIAGLVLWTTLREWRSEFRPASSKKLEATTGSWVMGALVLVLSILAVCFFHFKLAEQTTVAVIGQPAQSSAPEPPTEPHKIAKLAPAPLPSDSPVILPENSNSDDVVEAVETWRQAMLANDPDRIAACYGEHLQRYFLQQNVDHDYVANYVREMLGNGDALQSATFSGTTINTLSDATAEVSFLEDATFVKSGVAKAAHVKTVLHLQQAQGEWKIVYERQFKP